MSFPIWLHTNFINPVYFQTSSFICIYRLFKKRIEAKSSIKFGN